jgi:RNA polymerase sigma-70 factor (ECF subfamily)
MSELKRTVRRAASGDEEAAGTLFDSYYPRVFRYALGKLARPDDAEDVAAETFARVLRDLDRFKWKGGGFEAWLFRIASNLVVDHVRAAQRERADEAATEVLERTTPERAVLASETQAEIGRAVARLGDDQREVVLLRFVAGLDTLETGKVMGRNANAVRQLQHRALENLRQMMSEETGRPWR